MKPKRHVVSVSAAAVAVLGAASAEAQWNWSPNGRSSGQTVRTPPEQRLNPIVRTWGEPPPEDAVTDNADINLTNEEWSLRCTFSGKLGAESTVTQRELEEHERRLTKRDFFERLNEFMLDHAGEFDWARLSCVNRYAADEIDQREQREARAIEKAERARARRRGNE